MIEILLPQIIEILSEVEGGLTAPDIALRLGTDRKTINSFLYRLEGREVERANTENPPRWKVADPTRVTVTPEEIITEDSRADPQHLDDLTFPSFEEFPELMQEQRAHRACSRCGASTTSLFCGTRCRNRALDDWIVEVITVPRFEINSERIRYALSTLDIPLLKSSELESTSPEVDSTDYSVRQYWELLNRDTRRMLIELKRLSTDENDSSSPSFVDTPDVAISLLHVSSKYRSEVVDAIKVDQKDVESKSLMMASELKQIEGVSSPAKKNIEKVISRAISLQEDLEKRLIDQLTLDYVGVSDELHSVLNVNAPLTLEQLERRFARSALHRNLELKDEFFEFVLACRSHPVLPTFSMVSKMELMIPKIFLEGALHFRYRLISTIQKQPKRLMTPSMGRLVTTLELVGGIKAGRTLEQLGTEFGVTRERIRQLLEPVVAVSGSRSLREFRSFTQRKELKRKEAEKFDRIQKQSEISSFIQDHPGISLNELLNIFAGFEAEVNNASNAHPALVLDVYPLENDDEEIDRVDIIDSLKAASLLSFPLTGNAYDRLLSEGYIKGVSRVRIMQVYGTWTEACLRAEVESGEPLKNVAYVRRWSEREMIQVVGQFLIDEDKMGRTGGVHTFGAWRSLQESADSLPSEGTIRNQVNGSWKRVKQLALVELRRNWSNPDFPLKVVH